MDLEKRWRQWQQKESRLKDQVVSVNETPAYKEKRSSRFCLIPGHHNRSLAYGTSVVTGLWTRWFLHDFRQYRCLSPILRIQGLLNHLFSTCCSICIPNELSFASLMARSHQLQNVRAVGLQCGNASNPRVSIHNQGIPMHALPSQHFKSKHIFFGCHTFLGCPFWWLLVDWSKAVLDSQVCVSTRNKKWWKDVSWG